MKNPGGRPAGRNLSDLELRHLRLLLELRSWAQDSGLRCDSLLEDFVLELREGGASARGLGEQLGVGPSTVQSWTANARRRRG